MSMPRPQALSALAAGLFALMTLSPAVSAQTLSDAEVTPEVVRDATDLREVLTPRPDVDTVDTALVFTNPRNSPTLVVCAGRNAEGHGVGRAKALVPAHGVRLILASDLSNGSDYIGSAVCKSRRHLVPSAFVIGADLSDAPATARRRSRHTQINFPIVATF